MLNKKYAQWVGESMRIHLVNGQPIFNLASGSENDLMRSYTMYHFNASCKIRVRTFTITFTRNNAIVFLVKIIPLLEGLAQEVALALLESLEEPQSIDRLENLFTTYKEYRDNTDNSLHVKSE